jgi:hypothetical protein
MARVFVVIQLCPLVVPFSLQIKYRPRCLPRCLKPRSRGPGVKSKSEAGLDAGRQAVGCPAGQQQGRYDN